MFQYNLRTRCTNTRHCCKYGSRNLFLTLNINRCRRKHLLSHCSKFLHNSNEWNCKVKLKMKTIYVLMILFVCCICIQVISICLQINKKRIKFWFSLSRLLVSSILRANLEDQEDVVIEKQGEGLILIVVTVYHQEELDQLY